MRKLLGNKNTWLFICLLLVWGTLLYPMAYKTASGVVWMSIPFSILTVHVWNKIKKKFDL